MNEIWGWLFIGVIFLVGAWLYNIIRNNKFIQRMT